MDKGFYENSAEFIPLAPGSAVPAQDGKYAGGTNLFHNPVIDGLLHNPVADTYFEPRSFESAKLYENLGIRTFKKYLPTADLFGRGQTITHPASDVLETWENVTRVAETAHVGGFALFAAAISDSIQTHGFNNSLTYVGIAANTLANVYPIMLQRYNRIRIQNILAWRQRRLQNPA